MSKRKKIFHKPEDQVPSADDILNYLNEDASPVPPAPKKSAPLGGVKDSRKKMKEESSMDDQLSKNEEEKDESIVPAPSASMEIFVSSKNLSSEGGTGNKKNKRKHELEKSMLSEPLVSDAVEGYALISDRKKAKNLIDEINQNISHQTRKKNNRAVLMRIAAIFLLALLVSGGSYYLFEQWTGDNMMAISNEKASPSSDKKSDSVSISGNKNADKNTLDQLALENEAKQELEEKRAMPGAKSINTDGYLSQEQRSYGPVNGEGNKDNNGTFNSSTLATLKESEKKEEEDLLEISPVNTAVQKPLETDSITAHQLTIANSMDYKTDDASETNTYQWKGERKKSVAVVKEKKARQKESNYYSPSPAKTKSESFSDEENKPSGTLKKGYLLEDGIRLYNEEKYTEAKEIFAGVLSTQPSNQEAIFYSGMSDYKTKFYDRSLSSLSKVVQASRRYDEARWHIALIYLETGKKEEARNLLKELSKTGNSYSDSAFEQLKKME